MWILHWCLSKSNLMWSRVRVTNSLQNTETRAIASRIIRLLWNWLRQFWMKLMDRSREQSVASSSQKDDATTKLRQGSILPRSVRDRLGLSAFKDNPDPVFVVISHSCDLVQPYATEPHVELIRGQS